MATFSTIPLEEARRAAMAPRRAAQEQYREYVRSLTPDSAGSLELGPEDRPVTERAQLQSAAKAEGVNLAIRRRGNTMVFWVMEEPPPPRGGAGRRGAQRSS